MKKSYWIILACLVIIATVIVATKGFNVGLKYSENDTISIEIEKEFDIADIKKITDEVFKGKKVIIQKVELYKDIVQITVDSATSAEIQSLNEKINEKYEIENETLDISVQHNANTKLSQIIKHYIIPVLLSIIIILCYEMIRYRKHGVLNVVKCNLLFVFIAQIILTCVYAICRIPVNEYTIIASLCLYLLSEYLVVKKFQKLEETAKENK